MHLEPWFWVPVPVPPFSVTVLSPRTVSLEAEDPGRACWRQEGLGFNQHSQRTRIRCGFVSGHVCINQYFRYNLVNSFNSKRMLNPRKLSRAKERAIFRKILFKQIGMDETF